MKPVTERRSLTRGTPESHLLDAEQHAEYLAARPAPRCPVRASLIEAFNAYAAAYGWREARAWAAARAHFRPGADKPPTAAADAAAALFKGAA